MNITVYCSSVDGLPQLWQDGARSVGQWIGAHGAQLVYGGIDSGLMHQVADAARRSGATVVGVVPSRKRGAASALNNVTIATEDLSDRKGTMQVLADVFVVLPGGYGTIDELAGAFSYLNFTQQYRPLIIFNPDGVFDHLLAQLRNSCAQGLMHDGRLDIIHEAKTVDALMAALDNTLSLKNR